MKCGYNCGYWWQDEDKDYPSCHFDHDSPWPAPANTMGKKMILTAIMMSALIPTRVAIPMIVKLRARKRPLFCI